MIESYYLVPVSLLAFFTGGAMAHLLLRSPYATTAEDLQEPKEGCCVAFETNEYDATLRFCRAKPDPRCGSGYCTADCKDICGHKCFDPMNCKHCDRAIHEHGPGKCLFEPTTYESQWSQRQAKKVKTAT